MLEYYSELDKTNSREIYLPFGDGVKKNYIIPNSFYINSKGLLFNSFGERGHKEENLMYIYSLAKYQFNGGTDSITLEKILLDEQETYKRIVETNTITRNDVQKYVHLDFCDLTDPLIIKLVIGIISSKIIFLKKFINLENNSKDKKADLDRIISLSKDDINDILVRYCGFHKVEAKEKRAITTSSLDLNIFTNYFENGWKVNLVPRISLRDEDTDVHRTIVVDNFVEKNPQYSDKIRIRKLS